MCPPATGLGAKFNETHFGFFKDAVDYVTRSKGMPVNPLDIAYANTCKGHTASWILTIV